MDAGQIYDDGNGGKRIVGPEDAAEKLAAMLNDPELHVAFSAELHGEESRMFTREIMRTEGFEYPVLLLPESTREQFLADEHGRAMPVHEGRFATITAPKMTAFGIVRPGDRS